MEKEKILKELDKKFYVMKKELGFKSSFKEIDSIFYIKDFALNNGFVSEELSRQMCSRITETYMSWISYLHSLVLPNPQNMLNMNESKIFSSQEKKTITKIMAQATELISRNNLIKITKDKTAEAKLIDDAVNFWKKTFKPKLKDITIKVNDVWRK